MIKAMIVLLAVLAGVFCASAQYYGSYGSSYPNSYGYASYAPAASYGYGYSSGSYAPVSYGGYGSYAPYGYSNYGRSSYGYPYSYYAK